GQMGVEERTYARVHEGATFIRHIKRVLGQLDLDPPRSTLKCVSGVLHELLNLLAAVAALRDSAFLAGILLNPVRILSVDADTSIAKVIDESQQCWIRIGPTPGNHGHPSVTPLSASRARSMPCPILCCLSSATDNFRQCAANSGATCRSCVSENFSYSLGNPTRPPWARPCHKARASRGRYRRLLTALSTSHRAFTTSSRSYAQ